jgi:hypothetical protein
LHALKEWRCYLEGRHFTLMIENRSQAKPLIFLQGVPTLNRRQARWLEYMSHFDCTWEYLSGSLNVADALSRHPSLQVALAVLTRGQAARQAATSPVPAPASAPSAPVVPSAPPSLALRLYRSRRLCSLPRRLPSAPFQRSRLTRPCPASSPRASRQPPRPIRTSWNPARHLADLTRVNGLWMRVKPGHRHIVVPNDDALRHDILRILCHYHDGPLAP